MLNLFVIGIRAVPNNPAFNRTLNTTYAGGINSAILRYQGAPVADPTTPIPTLNDTLVESKLEVCVHRCYLSM
jgi:iron transport multicopper oxidase